MQPFSAQRSDLAAGSTGAVAGLLASTIQAGMGWVLDRTLLPSGHDNNIAPRLVHRTARESGYRTHPLLDWLVGTAFHFGYGLGWGVLFGLARRRLRLPSLALGSALGGLLYVLAFSKVGFGTRTHTEQEPEQRPWRKQLSLVAVAMTYALSLALLYDRLPPQLRR